MKGGIGESVSRGHQRIGVGDGGVHGVVARGAGVEQGEEVLRVGVVGQPGEAVDRRWGRQEAPRGGMMLIGVPGKAAEHCSNRAMASRCGVWEPRMNKSLIAGTGLPWRLAR